MKAIKFVPLILVIVLGVVIVSALIDNPIGANDNSIGVEKITSENFRQGGVHEVIGDITVKLHALSFSYELSKSKDSPQPTKEDLFYFEDEDVDENGTLTGSQIYVELYSIITNKTNETIEVDLEEFYLVTIDENWNVARGSRMPRYADLISLSDDVALDNDAVLDKFKLTLKPHAETGLEIMYVEERSHINVGSGLQSICYYRVKCNDEIGYYSVSASLERNSQSFE